MLLRSFFENREKPVYSVGKPIGDVRILLPTGFTARNELKNICTKLIVEQDEIRLQAPQPTPTSDLILRICGRIGAPKENLALYFCGNMLKNEEDILMEAYEQTSPNQTEDQDIFRPRRQCIL